MRARSDPVTEQGYQVMTGSSACHIGYHTGPSCCLENTSFDLVVTASEATRHFLYSGDHESRACSKRRIFRRRLHPESTRLTRGNYQTGTGS